MKTLANLNVPKDTSPKFPYGTIQNETDTQEGTPVVRELYGDILTNLWKLLELTGVTPTGDEDSDITQYQLVEAFQKIVNTHNDIEQTVSLVSTTWNVGLNLDLLPNRYVFIGRASDNYDESISYQFKGLSGTTYNATSPTGFSVNDEIIVVVDTSEVRMYNITRLTDIQENNIVNVYGAPISFNNTSAMYYFESGKFYNETPQIFDIEENLQTVEVNPNLVICDVIVSKGKLIVMAFDTLLEKYSLYRYELTNPIAPEPITIPAPYNTIQGVDNNVYMYCDGEFLYFSSDFNNSVQSEVISKFSYDENANVTAYVSSITLSNGNFKATTNTVIKNDILYTFI